MAADVDVARAMDTTDTGQNMQVAKQHGLAHNIGLDTCCQDA